MGLFSNDKKEWGGPEYPPSEWVCPQCKKRHSKAHFRRPGQQPYYGPAGGGFQKEETMKDACTEGQDEPVDPETSMIKPLFCGHCGYEETPRIVLILNGHEARKYIQ